jgi:hypothetical protein
MEDSVNSPVEIFVSYSHGDDELRKRLIKHLDVQRRQGFLSIWHDRKIGPGEEWKGKIDERMNSARIILLLVSANFLSSDYCYDVEMDRAMKRHEAGEAKVIPIILRECSWEGSPLGKLQALPPNAKPVTRWKDRDRAFKEIAVGIRSAALSVDLPIRHPTIDSTLPPSPTVRARTPDGLRSVVPNFTGRNAEIRRISGLLRGYPEADTTPSILGMGGVGKTALAFRVAHEVKPHFVDGQLPLEMHGMRQDPLPAAEAMRLIIRTFAPWNPPPESQKELLTHYRSVLANKRALILLDDVADEVQVQDLITIPPPVRFLLTSRRVLALDGVIPIRLDLFTVDESLLLLREILPAKGTVEELREVARLCDGLPLALRVAGDFLRLKEDWTVAKYLTALECELLDYLRIESYPDKNVEAVLKFSAVQLVRENPGRARRWHHLSHFAGAFDATAVAAAWGLPSDAVVVPLELSALVDRSMLLYDPNSTLYRLHDLMRPIAEELYG